MPKLGQHFLKNQKALSLIAHSLDINEGDIVIEIGAGHGELTKELMTENFPPKADTTPAEKLKTFKIIAIERDPELVEFLRKRFSEYPNIEIDEGDVLKKIRDSVKALGAQPYKIAGNIPYYLTGKLLRTIGELPDKPTVCIFTIQKEVAERIVAGPPRMNPPIYKTATAAQTQNNKIYSKVRNNKHSIRIGGGMNRLAASIAFWAEPKIIGNLPRADFNPPPRVDSAIIKLTAQPRNIQINSEKYYRAVRALFSQPRKTILNNLAARSDGKKEWLAEELKKVGVDPEARPHNLAIDDIIHIAENIKIGED